MRLGRTVIVSALALMSASSFDATPAQAQDPGRMLRPLTTPLRMILRGVPRVRHPRAYRASRANRDRDTAGERTRAGGRRLAAGPLRGRCRVLADRRAGRLRGHAGLCAVAAGIRQPVLVARSARHPARDDRADGGVRGASRRAPSRRAAPRARERRQRRAQRSRDLHRAREGSGDAAARPPRRYDQAHAGAAAGPRQRFAPTCATPSTPRRRPAAAIFPPRSRSVCAP